MGGSPAQIETRPSTADPVTGAVADSSARLRSGLPVAGLAGAAAVVAVAASGRCVAPPLVAAGVLAVVAAVSDARTGRIPNTIAAAVALWVVAGVIVVIGLDHRSAGEGIGSVLAGLVLSEAPFLAAMWVVRPSVIGGGDVKLLSGLGCTVGLLSPYAASVLVLVAVIVTLGLAAVARGRHVVFGPGLAVGYVLAVAAGVAANEVLGGRYL